MLRISWKKKVTNEIVLRNAKVGREVLKILKVKKMRYFGHIIRQEGIQKKLVEGKVNGKRPRGRPRTCWMTNIKDWAEMGRYKECARATRDRMMWKKIVAKIQKNVPT